MGARKNNKEAVNIAIAWVKNTNVEVEKIADYFSFVGDSKKQFCEIANDVRKKTIAEREKNSWMISLNT
jgi:hypothetical protein